MILRPVASFLKLTVQLFACSAGYAVIRYGSQQGIGCGITNHLWIWSAGSKMVVMAQLRLAIQCARIMMMQMSRMRMYVTNYTMLPWQGCLTRRHAKHAKHNIGEHASWLQSVLAMDTH